MDNTFEIVDTLLVENLLHFRFLLHFWVKSYHNYFVFTTLLGQKLPHFWLSTILKVLSIY